MFAKAFQVISIIFNLVILIMSIVAISKESLCFTVGLVILNSIGIGFNKWLILWLAAVPMAFITVLMGVFAFMLFMRDRQSDQNVAVPPAPAPLQPQAVVTFPLPSSIQLSNTEPGL